MRKQQEINRAAAILRKKGDRISVAQAEVLEQKRTETQLFKEFVMSVGEEKKDEQFFYALRDAARYVAGGMELEDLIPDADKYPVDEQAGTDAGSVTLSRKEYNDLLVRIGRLEQWIGLSRKPATLKPVEMPEEMDMADMLKQNEACAYLECGKNTIKKWAAKGLVHAYQKGKYVYYSKKEIDKKVKKLRKEAES